VTAERRDAIARAARDARLERRVSERHQRECGWCTPARRCPMGRMIFENANAYGDHLFTLAGYGGPAYSGRAS
jgi:hypothetical protein